MKFEPGIHPQSGMCPDFGPRVLCRFGDDLGRLLESMIGGRHPAIDRLLQDDFLDVVRREAALAQRRPHMQAELVPLGKCDHGADHQHAARAFVEMRPRPHFTPSGAGDEILEFFRERRLLGVGAIDPFVSQHLAALGHAVLVALLLVHRGLYPRRKLSTVSV
jgi:hypothetical protein